MRRQNVPPTTDWKELYGAALFEKDKRRMSLLIEDAERAIALRSRQLFAASGENWQEQQALDNALLALHALKRCLATSVRRESGSLQRIKSASA
jgi:hypothetical protein